MIDKHNFLKKFNIPKKCNYCNCCFYKTKNYIMCKETCIIFEIKQIKIMTCSILSSDKHYVLYSNFNSIYIRDNDAGKTVFEKPLAKINNSLNLLKDFKKLTDFFENFIILQ